ncbi:MAG TPA: hypothetical protein VLE73_05905 [Candidatus Saccharimonadales bacterium]|nr:hypothetical protein [Candidatus Saccharimonadales bacterium]
MSPQEMDPSRYDLQPGITPDLRILLPAAETGDEAAVAALHALNGIIIASRLRRYSGLRIDRDNIRGAVVEKLLQASFDPHWPLPEGTPPEAEAAVIMRRYRVYVAKTIRSAVADDTPRRTMEIPLIYDPKDRVVESAKETRHNNGNGVAAIPDEIINETLTELQQTIFYLRREGVKYPEMSEQLGMGYVAIKGVMHRAIQRLEKRILNPAGLLRINQVIEGTDFKHKTVLTAIYRGDIQAVKIFDRWYTKPEWLDDLRQPKNTVLLSDMADQATVLAVRRRYANRLITHNGRVYIRAEDVELVAEISKEKRLSRRKAIPPKLGYISLGDLECTATEYRALRKSTYSEIIARGRRRFVPEDEALDQLERLRAKKQDPPASSTSGNE